MPNTARTARDFERYRSMLTVIDAYQEGKCSICSLVSTLKKLQRDLERPDPDWKDDFFQAWGMLDICHVLLARAVEDDPVGELTPYQMTIFDDALLKARTLLMQRLRN